MKILLVGNGKMAAAVIEECNRGDRTDGTLCYSFNPLDPHPTTDTVAIHFGSGRELYRLIEYCELYNIPLINGSTRLTCEEPGVEECSGIRYINAPNTCVPLVRFMASLPDFFAYVSGKTLPIQVSESHQKGKPDTSGTARALARRLGVSEDSIHVERDPQRQVDEWHVPVEHLDGHAYHSFEISLGGQNAIEIQTRIHGRSAYAQGALEIAAALLKRGNILGCGKHYFPNIIDTILPLTEE